MSLFFGERNESSSLSLSLSLFSLSLSLPPPLSRHLSLPGSVLFPSFSTQNLTPSDRDPHMPQ